MSIQFLFGLCFALSIIQTDGISPEGVARRDAHDFLINEFCQGKETIFKGTGPTRILEEVVLATNQEIRLEETVEIPMPEGSARVASMFRYVVLKGEKPRQH
jgi:agarase